MKQKLFIELESMHRLINGETVMWGGLIGIVAYGMKVTDYMNREQLKHRQYIEKEELKQRQYADKIKYLDETAQEALVNFNKCIAESGKECKRYEQRYEQYRSMWQKVVKE